VEGDETRAALNAAMDRYAEGDDAAFAQVYDLLAPRLLGFFTRQIRDAALAEDLTQHTLLQMHAARRNYVRGSEVLSWAFAIGRNAMIDGLRKSRREVLWKTAEEDAAAVDWKARKEGFVSDAGPEDLASARQTAERVSAELDRLPQSQRQAYDLVRHEGMSVAQTAEVMGTTPMAIKLRVHRVYEALRAVLGAEKRPLKP
jgi:RNA polymerase sigma-70 factor (ECF subfamily)